METSKYETSISEIPQQVKESYLQVDILKAVMIFLVIFDHTIPWDPYKNAMGVALRERISIPVFLVIMGFNMGSSFKQKGETSLRKLYSWKYFKRKIWRYIIPFFLLYLVSTLLGLAIKALMLLVNIKVDGVSHISLLAYYLSTVQETGSCLSCFGQYRLCPYYIRDFLESYIGVS